MSKRQPRTWNDFHTRKAIGILESDLQGAGSAEVQRVQATTKPKPKRRRRKTKQYDSVHEMLLSNKAGGKVQKLAAVSPQQNKLDKMAKAAGDMVVYSD